MVISLIGIVMNILMSNVELKRKQALLILLETAENWNKEYYETKDFCLDRCLREILELPEKSLGKSPYDWVKL